MAKRIVVVGAGAAGLMAAARAAELGADVMLLEKTDEAGKKILVSGKSRCNLTNAAPLRQFLAHYGRNGKFLMNAYHRFFRDELLALLERYGVQTQTERGGRIFPASGQASDVRDALIRYATGYGVNIRYRSEVGEIVLDGDRVRGLRMADKSRITTDTVILATGGASWPETGSTGQGYLIAQAVGHTIEPLRPALVPLTVVERSTAKSLQGVSLRNVRCTFTTIDDRGKERPLRIPYPMPETGEMLFTHFGVSGPLILTASLAVVDALRRGRQVVLSIDLKPGMDEDAIHSRLQREFETHAHQRLRTLLRGWVPGSLADVIADLSPVEDDRHIYRIRAEERIEIVSLLKDFRWTIAGSLPLASGMVTAGGVALGEVDPVTFASRKVAGLYIVGELLDLAADTGGFNLQAAFTTGYLAGTDAAASTTDPRL
ncbi:MAG: NAD(P)/FAD-dependent oxidoreductase [Anaerolineae bacterium]|nr:NAD(P)/FAD-dependent oxidoreductase [Anaerolineae bacterium]